MHNNKALLDLAIEAAIAAGKETLKYYSTDIQVQLKDDNSPLTQADLGANNIIESTLRASNIPVLSEESKAENYLVRKSWKKLWVVDPLDGTKEFIKKSDEYTVNIALVENNCPIMGVVYAPAKDILYYADTEIGAFKLNEASVNIKQRNIAQKIIGLKNEPISGEMVIVASKSHQSQETKDFISKLSGKYPNIQVKSFGSSLKLCMVAEGKAAMYPRLGPTMEWDTAASHAIVVASGCEILKFPTLEAMEYNKEELLNPHFIVYHKIYQEAIQSLS